MILNKKMMLVSICASAQQHVGEHMCISGSFSARATKMRMNLNDKDKDSEDYSDDDSVDELLDIEMDSGNKPKDSGNKPKDGGNKPKDVASGGNKPKDAGR